MNKKRLIGLAIGIGLLCTGTAVVLSVGLHSNEIQTPAAIESIVHRKSIGDLSYEVRLDKNAFRSDEAIEVYAKVTNTGQEKISYVSGSSSCPTHVIINIVNEDSDHRLAPHLESKVCTDDLGTSSLAPGQSIEETMTFTPAYYYESGLVPAPGGTYQVRAVLPENLETFLNNEKTEIKKKRPPATVTINLVSDETKR